jgi:hypothetical protein
MRLPLRALQITIEDLPTHQVKFIHAYDRLYTAL